MGVGCCLCFAPWQFGRKGMLLDPSARISHLFFLNVGSFILFLHHSHCSFSPSVFACSVTRARRQSSPLTRVVAAHGATCLTPAESLRAAQTRMTAPPTRVIASGPLSSSPTLMAHAHAFMVSAFSNTNKHKGSQSNHAYMKRLIP